jgi:hypothetical protein
LEEAIQKISFKAFHVFRPSLLLGDRKEIRTGEKIGAFAMMALKNIMIGRLKKYRAVQARDVAKVMVGAAQMNLTGMNIFESERIQEIADLL